MNKSAFCDDVINIICIEHTDEGKVSQNVQCICIFIHTLTHTYIQMYYNANENAFVEHINFPLNKETNSVLNLNKVQELGV